MKRNTAGQVIGVQMVSATDGSAFTGTVNVFITGDGGSQAAGTENSGQATHKGNGYHEYAPSQAETDFAHIAFTFVGSGAVPVTIQVYTTHPQSGDAYERLGAPDGASIAEDIAGVLDQEVEPGVTARQSLRLANAAAAGKASGLNTDTARYRNLADTKDRITATVDQYGNRTSVTLDLT